MTPEQLAHELANLHKDMTSCGFNSFGLKQSVYYSWCSRVEFLQKQAKELAEKAEEPALPPPPPPVSV